MEGWVVTIEGEGFKLVIGGDGNVIEDKTTVPPDDADLDDPGWLNRGTYAETGINIISEADLI
jgi:hypothetical protein